MSQTTVVRTGKDRLRYTIVFEATLMMALIPAGAVFFGKGLADIGLLGIVLSLKAMLVNLVYNWLFDHVERSDDIRLAVSCTRSDLRPRC